jgi:DNA polymerase, archaea type
MAPFVPRRLPMHNRTVASQSSRYHMICEQFYGNRLLFGDPSEGGIVAVELNGNQAELLRRSPDGTIIREKRPLRLFLLAADLALMKGFRGPYQATTLTGDFPLRHLLAFDSADALDAARRHLRKAQPEDPPWMVLTDPVEQHLMLTGATYFMGMQFGELRRMQLAVATSTTAGFEFSSAARADDRVVAIALSDSAGFECVLQGSEMDEPAILEQLVRIVRERDPDVIEGHSLFRLDLEYLEARARRCRIKLNLGRDGSPMRGRSARMQIAERTIAYRRYDVYGRNLIDTWILAQHYDIASRELEGFGLKELSAHFGLERADRGFIEAGQVSQTFASAPDQLYASLSDDVRATRQLSDMLAPSYFVQAQIFPYSFQNVVLRGNATKIDAILMRAYLAQHHSIPLPAPPSEVAGGYTEVRRCGVARNVLHCDVTSLYPSLMLEGKHGPGADKLGVFLRMLADLRSFRIQAKAAVSEVTGSERRNLEALQQTFKILINSFYGYLGFAMGHFNDFAQANAVTRRGRELIQRAIIELEARHADVIEVDTDGIYFVAPFPMDDDSAAQALLDAVAATMPPGIRLEIDGRYPGMFSYKMKNYVLLDERGELTIRGSGLKSRGLERFQRRFMEELFQLLLEENRDTIPALYESCRASIANHQIGITELMKTETLQDSPEVYKNKIGGKRRNAAAAYELALKATRPYQSGDRVSYYVAGSGKRVKVNAAAKLVAEYDAANPDENIEYYLAKLAELYEKFRPFAERPGLFVPSAAEAAPDPSGSSQSDMFTPSDKG